MFPLKNSKMYLFLGKKYVYVAVFTVNILALTAGTLLTWTSPVLPKLNSNDTIDQNPLKRVISDDEQSWIGSLSSIGGIFGPIFFMIIIEHLGRKPAAIFCTIPYIASFLLAAFATNIWMFYVSRFLAGIGIGATFTISAIYNGEVAEKHNRGVLASSSSVFILGGCLISYTVGPYTSLSTFNFILSVFPILAFVGIVILAPESPYFLVHKNRTVDALRNLRTLRGSNDKHVDIEFEEIKNDVSKVVNGGIMDIFKSRAATKAFYMSMIIINAQQFSGILVMLAYTQDIFKATGGNLDSALSSIVVGLTQFLTVYITPLLADRLGRKKLLLFSTTGIIICLVTLGLFFYLQQNDNNFNSYSDNIFWVPIVSFVIYFIFYNSGMGSLPWTLLSELYPLNVKSVGTSVTTSVYWVIGFLLNYYFTPISKAVGMGVTFWFFSGVCILTFLYVLFFVFETKGKTLQEIQDILAS